MKKMICISLLTMVVLLAGNIRATAQSSGGSGQSGNSFYCYSVSASTGFPLQWFDVWEAGSNGYTVSVNMEVYEESGINGEAFSDVAFGDFYWSYHIYGGDYADAFIAAGSGDIFELSTYARGGEAYIQASW